MAKDKLSDRQIRKLPVGKHFDGGGLHVLVHQNGSRYWHLKYRLRGHENTYAIGVYPRVSLAAARSEAARARELIRNGFSPIVERRRTRAPNASETFQGIAEEWIATNQDRWSASYLQHVKDALTNNIFPSLGSLPIKSIDVQKMRGALLVMQERNALALLQQVRGWSAEIFRFAIATDRADSNPAATLAGTFKRHKTGNIIAILDPKEFGALMRAIRSYDSLITRLGLLFIAYSFVRSSELRGATWNEFNGTAWNIPGTRMKNGLDHVVPLSRQTKSILKQLKPVPAASDFVFAHDGKPLSENTLLNALHRLGYKGRHAVHGFRSSASTMLREQLDFPGAIIERQLAHVERNKVSRAYDRALYLPQRQEMMQKWADFVDGLSAS
jgi:integrase